MDSKKTITEEVQSVLELLYQKIDSLKEKVDKLCESTDCFETLDPNVPAPESDE